MLKNLQSSINVTKNWYYTYQKQIKLISGIKINNKLLAQELEDACQKQLGILTYEEYLTIEQFGKHGFYTTNKNHGETDVDTRWGSALANYCRLHGYDTIIEFGCGTGELGIAIIKAHKKLTHKPLTWIGVEIDKHIHEKIYEKFISNDLHASIGAVVATIDALPALKKPLIVFPYSLDNIPTQVFLNSKSSLSYPDTLLGISVSKGKISEMLIPQSMLHKKGMKLENGIFTQNKAMYKLSGWKLRKGQRVYIAIEAFKTLYQFATKFSDSTMFIIDEFRNAPWIVNLDHLGTPKSLYEKNLVINELARYYSESGNHNLYYPLYKESLLKFLVGIGFRSVAFDIEQKKAAELIGKRWLSLKKNYATYAFIAKDFVKKDIKTLTIPSPQKKLY